MKTQTIKVQIEAEVPMGKYCLGCPEYGKHAICEFFRCLLVFDDDGGKYEKAKQCLDACTNGTERALKELAE